MFTESQDRLSNSLNFTLEIFTCMLTPVEQDHISLKEFLSIIYEHSVKSIIINNFYNIANILIEISEIFVL